MNIREILSSKFVAVFSGISIVINRIQPRHQGAYQKIEQSKQSGSDEP
jgi:hypothetical protein